MEENKVRDLWSLLSEARKGEYDKSVEEKRWGRQARQVVVSHLVVGLEELVSGAFAFVLPSLLLYNGRVPVIAAVGPLESGTLDWAIEGEMTDELDEVVVDTFWSITIPRVHTARSSSCLIEPCRNDLQARLD